MNHPLSTSTPKSTLPEQTRAAALSVEIMNDLDTGQPMLLASTEPNQSDLQVVTLNQVLASVAEQHRRLDGIVQLAVDWNAQQADAADSKHFPWCQPDDCTTGTPDEHGEYIDHEGPLAAVHAPSFLPTAEGFLLRARLCSDATDLGGATVSITGSNGNGSLLTGAELDPIIDELAAFLDRLRAMRPHLKADAA